MGQEKSRQVHVTFIHGICRYPNGKTQALGPYLTADIDYHLSYRYQFSGPSGLSFVLVSWA
jgi:hypothetical protein